MQRSTSWLSAIAQAAGRFLGVVDSGPILPVYTPPASPSETAEPVGFTDISGARLPADKWSTMAEAGGAAASVWLEIGRRMPFIANPLTGAAQGAY
jgi:hypothetical protein